MSSRDPATEQADRPLDPDNWRRIATLEANQRRLEAAIIDLLDRLQRLEEDAATRRFTGFVRDVHGDGKRVAN